MYRREKHSKPDENHHHKSRKGQHHTIPSFSSTLLDEIYRSIDGNVENPQDLKLQKEKPVKKQSIHRAKANGNGNKYVVEDEGVASFRRACLVEKSMEKEVGEKVSRSKQSSLLQEKDNDVLFFSSSSSDSSGQLSSSSDEYFGSKTKPLKPVRTSVANRRAEQQEDDYLFDDYKNHQKKLAEDEFIKSKSRALKIYANLKKMKQPISPGGRLTTFINSLFNKTNAKKAKNADMGHKPLTSCSSATSFSYSCLSKCSPRSREKTREGIQRTIRFHPVSVIVDEDLRPCGQKCIPEEDAERNGRPPLPPNALAELRQSIREKNRKIEEAAQKVLQGYNRKNKDDFSIFRKINRDVEDQDDAMSDSSSDLFELDHLASFSKNRYCDELPVYETTHFDTNRDISNHLVQ